MSKKILVVEDFVDSAMALVALLNSKGYQALPVFDGAEALARMDDFHPDLVLLDLMMPVLDGFGFLQEIRQNPKWEAIPVIVLSAVPGREARDRAFAYGAYACMPKPLEFNMLLDMIAPLMGNTPDSAAR
jgi:CheY-like chemotaxis protein